MPLTRNRFLLYLSLACMAGYIWLALISRLKPEEVGTQYDVCVIHHFAHIPCPSCGSTRSVLALMHGDIWGGLYWNPLGFVIFMVMVISPFWIACDLITRKSTLLNFFHAVESTFQRKWVAIPAILLVLLNWIWNIIKDV